MARPKFVQAKKTTVLQGFSELETSEIRLKNLVDIYDNNIVIGDVTGNGLLKFTFNPGSDNEEIIFCTGFTRETDGTITLDAGILRARAGVFPYGSGGTARKHAAGTAVVLSNTPSTLEEILEYIDGIAIAGAPDASQTAKGLVEVATAAEINAGTATGATGAPIAVTPDQLALSNYGLRLITAEERNFLSASVGMVIETVRDTAPTGFFMADGASKSASLYPDLAVAIKGRYGYGGTGFTFTVNAGTDIITASTHGLSDGNIIFLRSTTTLPAGLSSNTPYYVISSTTNTFKLSTASGGSAIDITDAGTGTHTAFTHFLLPNRINRSGVGAGTLTQTFTFAPADVDTGTEYIVLTSSLNMDMSKITTLYTGQAVVLTATGTPPTGLTAGVTYYVIRISATQIQLASSRAEAIAGTAINLTGIGTGVNTLTHTSTTRSLGDMLGENDHSTTLAESPSHTHATGRGSAYTSSASASDFAWAQQSTNNGSIATSSSGGSTAHNITNPEVVMNYMIKY